MYKIILHMGFPKTATTSLQNNFFLELHRQGKINYLGRAYTITNKNYFFPFDNILRILRTPLSFIELEKQRQAFFGMLSENKVNMISEESLTVTTQQDHELIYENLKHLTEGCQVTVLLCLRNPIEFMYSAYVEMHRWHYHTVKGKNTVSGIVEHLCKEPGKPEYDMFFFDRILEKIKRNFPYMSLYLFEDFVNSKVVFSELIIRLLEINPDDVRLLNSIGKENVRQITESGKRGEGLTLNQSISMVIGKLFSEKTRLSLKENELIRLMYIAVIRASNKIMIGRATHHPCLSDVQIEKLSDLLLLDPTQFSIEYGLDKEKLIQYGYAHSRCH